MDAQRSRRTKDQARKAWYAYYRQVRFARWFGFIEIDADWNQIYRGTPIRADRTSSPRVSQSKPNTVEFGANVHWFQAGSST